MTLDELRILCAAAIVLSAAAIIIFERKFPYTKHQSFFREGFAEDFFWYSIFQSFLLGILISYFITFIDETSGLSGLKLISDWPIIYQFLFFLVVHDFYIYWFHRFQHNSNIFWRIHEAHHSNRQVDWLSGSRSHVLEILINQTIEFAPIVLLGAAPEIAVIKGAVDAVWGMYIHSNINVKSGKLQYFVNGPEMHRWHHADRDTKAYNKNFSTKIAIWDWLFGTAYFPVNKKPDYYGLSDLDFPKNYFLQQVFALRRNGNDEFKTEPVVE